MTKKEFTKYFYFYFDITSCAGTNIGLGIRGVILLIN